MSKIQVNKVYGHLKNSDKKIVVEQGGTRSGKTYNIILWIIFYYCGKNEGKTITIARKTFPAVRSSVMRDFMEILKAADLYREENHNKSNSEYILNGNLVEFISMDQPQKIRGRKRDLAFLNEANELTFEDWQQIVFRTNGRIILDYNPSDTFHWIYDKVIPRDDVDFFQTTYKDNPFLDDTIIKEIERLRDTDEHYWRVYGLGERGTNRAQVFQFTTIQQIPQTAKFLSFGLDFGFTNDPSALVGCYKEGDNLYFEELLYSTNLTNQDLAREFSKLEIGRYDEIFGDSSEPKSIEELHRMGWNIKPTQKGADSVNAGIDMLKRYKIHIIGSNLMKEMENYKWLEDKNGNLLNKPEDKYNHLIDALRYGVYNKLSKPNYGRYTIR
tara:strand:+ start:11303 stop:12457 length:1155 start_codon:yes stop_codon:yes gene_type:complete